MLKDSSIFFINLPLFIYVNYVFGYYSILRISIPFIIIKSIIISSIKFWYGVNIIINLYNVLD